MNKVYLFEICSSEKICTKVTMYKVCWFLHGFSSAEICCTINTECHYRDLLVVTFIDLKMLNFY